MDLEKAYNKIDNFCCSNHNTLQGNKVRYLNGREETIDMFSDYKENKDDDFCKDAYEMVEALETIKEVVDLQKELGCPLDVYVKLVTKQITTIYDELGEMCTVRNVDSANCIYVSKKFKGDFWLRVKHYKKTWWLKADRSE